MKQKISRNNKLFVFVLKKTITQKHYADIYSTSIKIHCLFISKQFHRIYKFIISLNY